MFYLSLQLSTDTVQSFIVVPKLLTFLANGERNLIADNGVDGSELGLERSMANLHEVIQRISCFATDSNES